MPIISVDLCFKDGGASKPRRLPSTVDPSVAAPICLKAVHSNACGRHALLRQLEPLGVWSLPAAVDEANGLHLTSYAGSRESLSGSDQTSRWSKLHR